jgi:hypothetical protein
MSMAVSKISCTPFISLEEHSMYFAPIFVATDLPCCCVTGVRPCVFRSSMHVRLFRRSDLRPQRMIGVVGQKWRTSGYHWKESVKSLGRIRLHEHEHVPYPEHFRVSLGSQWRSRRKANRSRGMKEVAVCRIPPGRQYPRAQAQHPSQTPCARLV